MKRSRFSEEQIIGILKEHQAGRCHVADLQSHEFRGLGFAQAGVVAVCHSLMAALRNWRNVLREIR